MASPRQVYVVGDDHSVDALTAALDGVSVHSVTAAEVGVTLCQRPVDCLVVPQDIEGTRPDRLVYSARGLYPDLPVVVFGPDAPESTEWTTVDASNLDEAVRETLSASPAPESGRTRSRPETMLAALFESYPAHLYAKDAEARHLLASDHIMDPAALLALTDMETLSGQESYDEANYTDDRTVIEDGEPILEIDEYSDSNEQFFRTSKVPWRDSDGEILGLVGITQDITEMREQKEELRRRNRRLRKVALMTAHELRNELQVLTGHCSQMDGDEETVAAAGESIDNLAGVVDQIVSLATYDESERDLTTLWLSALTREVWEGNTTAGASLTLGDDRRLLGDRDATQLLVELLVDNALTHAGPEVTVEVGATPTGFYVADDGPGVTLDPPQRAFEAGVSSRPDRSGFGLYIARQIADEQGWRVEVGAAEGGGARFDVVGVEDP